MTSGGTGDWKPTKLKLAKNLLFSHHIWEKPWGQFPQDTWELELCHCLLRKVPRFPYSHSIPVTHWPLITFSQCTSTSADQHTSLSVQTHERKKKLCTGCIKGHLLCTTQCLLFYANLNTSAVFIANCCLLVLFPLAKTIIFPASVSLQEKPHIHTFLAFSTGQENWFPGIRMASSKENICCQLRFDL